MTIKFKPHRTGPPEGSWRRLCQGMAIDVVGLHFRRANALAFIKAGEKLHLNNREFGITARREPNNPHSKRGYATAIDGWWSERGLFGAQRERVMHLGYLPEWASEEALHERTPEPPIFAELYSAYKGHDDYVDIEIIVHVQRTPAEIVEIEQGKIDREAEKVFARALSRGLKVLARVASADSEISSIEREHIADFVRAEYQTAARPTDEETVLSLVSEAVDEAPSHSAAQTAARKLAEEGDTETLRRALEAAFRLVRSDGVEASEEVQALKSLIGTVRKKARLKASQFG